KVNQVRCQAWDWQAGGLNLPSEVLQQIQEASAAFSDAIALVPSPAASARAQTALGLAYRAADQLVESYQAQMHDMHHQRQPRFNTLLGCRLTPQVVDDPSPATLAHSFNAVDLP